MRPHPAAAVVLLALALSGCLDASFRMAPLDIRIDLSEMDDSASLSAMDARPGYDLSGGRAVIHVTGAVRTTQAVDGVTVDLYLTHDPCPTGPSGRPERAADHERILLGRVNGTASFEADLSASALPAEPMSVHALVQSGGTGPSFTTCEDVMATPAPVQTCVCRLG